MRHLAAAALAAIAAVAAAGCGGGSGGTTSKADWQKQNGNRVAAFSRSLSDGLNTVNQGEKSATLSTCTEVSEDAAEVRKKALPVPDPAADAALRTALDQASKGADDCLKGGRQTDARAVEAAQREFADARKAMDEAEAAINSWR